MVSTKVDIMNYLIVIPNTILHQGIYRQYLCIVFQHYLFIVYLFNMIGSNMIVDVYDNMSFSARFEEFNNFDVQFSQCQHFVDEQ